MGSRARRSWYKKKTNWGVIATIISSGLVAFPPTMTVGIVLLGMSRALAGFASSDRGGKPNENITSRKRMTKSKEERIAVTNIRNVTNNTDTEPVNVNITEE